MSNLYAYKGTISGKESLWHNNYIELNFNFIDHDLDDEGVLQRAVRDISETDPKYPILDKTTLHYKKNEYRG